MPEQDESFDPYRFGHPDTPPPPEYAPPGYKPPPVDLSKPTPYPGPPSLTPPPAYGPPVPYPPYQPYPQSRGGTSGKAVASLVLGILSIILCFTTILDAILIILALIFGIIGLNDAKTKRIGGRGQAIAGLICAAVGAVLAITFAVLVFRAADQCGGLENNDAPGFQQCVTDHLFS